MKRRLTIARSLINEPDLLLLDEPTTGLDPQARHVVWDRLFRLKQQGVTLVLTTHYMDEAEQLCDRLVVMDGGRIAAEGSPARADPRVLDPRGRRAALRRRRERGAGEKVEAWSRAERPLHRAGHRVEVLPDRVLLYSRRRRRAVAEVHQRGRRSRSRCSSAAATLEDVFLRLTGRSLVD